VTKGEPDDGYPDVDRHVPWNECRTLTSYFDGARQDLHGPPIDLEVYAAAGYQFGALELRRHRQRLASS
jgi:hypothetical protein